MEKPSLPSPVVSPPSVRRRLDEVVARIRLLRTSAGLARLLSLLCLALVVLYAGDRLLELPRAVRAVVGLVLAAAFVRQAWRRVGRPLLRGPDRLDAARLVERTLDLQGRLVSSLQLPAGPLGSLEHRLVQEAEQLAVDTDLRSVLVARPSLRELYRAAGAAAVLLLLLVTVRPHVEVFARRWLLEDLPWPRETHLQLRVPASSPVHVLEGGVLIASRGGTVSISAGYQGKRPERVELVVSGQDGERSSSLAQGATERFVGHLTVQPGDHRLWVRGGDDSGDETVLEVRVLEPPRVDDPVFRIEPPAYIGQAARDVASEDLIVPEGTAVSVRGRANAPVTAATLWLLGSGQSMAMTVEDDVVSGQFVADSSDTLSVVLAGEYGLTAPEPGQHALLVHQDRPPVLRVHAPARSDVKVTANAVLPFAVMADDDHGVDGVSLRLGDAGGLLLEPSGDSGAYRHVLDLSRVPLSGSVPYELSASDRRQLPGKGPQTATAAGRRIDVVDAAEVQRLLADRQLRLKEAFLGVRERQQLALAMLDDLLLQPPAVDDPDLVAAAVAQNQVTTRLARETRELCAILDETILDRLDRGPGAEAVLQRRLADWRAAPVDRVFDAQAWQALAADYGAGRFGRLDVVGRLMEMAALALDLSEQRSPQAHGELVAARNEPGSERLSRAREAQRAVLLGLDRLLERMDEWEDYQEVVNLVKTLIDDQRSLREASQRALTGGSGDN